MVYPYCSICKGTRDLCGLGRCPLLESIRNRITGIELKGRSVEGGSPPSVFVGRYGYPRISVGPLATPVQGPHLERLESPEYLYTRPLEEVYSLRSSLIRGRHRLDVKVAKDQRVIGSEPLYTVEKVLPLRSRKVLSTVQELSLSGRSIDTEMSSPRNLSSSAGTGLFDSISMPMGPSIEISGVSLRENPRVPNQIERVAGDTDLRASEASIYLHGSGIGTRHIVRLLSVGLLGDGRRRKLVPTRWSITAVDDIISKELIKKCSCLQPLDHYRLFGHSRFGNHFLIALFPPPFRFEMMEQWQSGSLWGGGDILHDHEGPRRRTTYASSITGAYYAARLSILEHLQKIGRSGGGAVIRWIDSDYWAPLGVWVIRETVKNALQGPHEGFNSQQELTARIDVLSGIPSWKSRSIYLSGHRESRLEEFT